MAEKLTDDFEQDGPAPKDHNQLTKDEIKAKIREANEALAPFEAQEAEAKAEQKKILHALKADTGITIGDFKAARRLAWIEDDDEQRQKLSSLALAFNALSEGGQLDFVEALEQQAA